MQRDTGLQDRFRGDGGWMAQSEDECLMVAVKVAVRDRIYVSDGYPAVTKG